MHENVTAIVEAALAKRPADVQELVSETLTDLTYGMVRELREEIERTMFQPVEEATVAVEVDGETYDLPESLVGEILDESEEIQAFLEEAGDELTEEQEDQLHELSTNTLKAHQARAKRSKVGLADLNRFVRSSVQPSPAPKK